MSYIIDPHVDTFVGVDKLDLENRPFSIQKDYWYKFSEQIIDEVVKKDFAL